MDSIKIAHEVPLCLLEESRKFNDYDYALVHLFKQYPEYLQFFKDSVEMGREVLLDNSIFELKTAFDDVEFANWVEELRPTRYIIPDVLDDCEKTIQGIDRWRNHFEYLPGRTIGVVQGKTYEELTKCYLHIVENCDEVALCFPHSHHQSKGLTKQAFHERMLNRTLLIDNWITDGIIQETKRHHLLGCLLPQEFKKYGGLDFLYSLDTSNPIIHGYKGVRYDRGTLDDKIDMKMAENMEIQLSEKNKADIMHNVKQFRENITW